MSRISQIQAMLAAGAHRRRPHAAEPRASRPRSRARRAPPPTAASTTSPPRTPPRRHGRHGPSSALPAGTPYGAEITAAAQANGLDPALLAGLIKQESGFNPNAGSGAGARGLTQLMPGTAAGLGVTNVLDPVQSINGGAKYLKQQLDTFGGDVTKALAAYNAGPGAVQRFGGVPPYSETQNYVRIVQANAAVLPYRSLRDLRPMTTDRTAAPAPRAHRPRRDRSARARASSRPPPADMFSALLGSVAPRAGDARRRAAAAARDRRADRRRAPTRPPEARRTRPSPSAADAAEPAEDEPETADEPKPRPPRHARAVRAAAREPAARPRPPRPRRAAAAPSPPRRRDRRSSRAGVAAALPADRRGRRRPGPPADATPAAGARRSRR